MGGSIIRHGGQNPLEAVRYGCHVLYGPNIWNFEEIYSLLETHKVSNKITTIKQLSHKVEQRLNSKNNSKNLKFKIKNLGNKILISTLNEINVYINK